MVPTEPSRVLPRNFVYAKQQEQQRVVLAVTPAAHWKASGSAWAAGWIGRRARPAPVEPLQRQRLPPETHALDGNFTIAR